MSRLLLFLLLDPLLLCHLFNNNPVGVLESFSSLLALWFSLLVLPLWLLAFHACSSLRDLLLRDNGFPLLLSFGLLKHGKNVAAHLLECFVHDQFYLLFLLLLFLLARCMELLLPLPLPLLLLLSRLLLLLLLLLFHLQQELHPLVSLMKAVQVHDVRVHLGDEEGEGQVVHPKPGAVVRSGYLLQPPLFRPHFIQSCFRGRGKVRKALEVQLHRGSPFLLLAGL
mmetsp:Transcript_9501/g.27014  ORF Transcript_9501/g.27014 Transcript_9501/m.27014 type:complete len:225 (+) Transcript_9501:201-875(+)